MTLYSRCWSCFFLVGAIIIISPKTSYSSVHQTLVGLHDETNATSAPKTTTPSMYTTSPKPQSTITVNTTDTVVPTSPKPETTITVNTTDTVVPTSPKPESTITVNTTDTVVPTSPKPESTITVNTTDTVVPTSPKPESTITANTTDTVVPTSPKTDSSIPTTTTKATSPISPPSTEIVTTSTDVTEAPETTTTPKVTTTISPETTGSTTSAPITTTGSGTSQTSPATSTSTSTAKPSLSDLEVLKQTKALLANVTETLNIFTDALQRPSTPAYKTAPRYFATVQQGNFDICDATIKKCKDLKKGLEDVNEEVQKIQTDSDSWTESDLNELRTRTEFLSSEVNEDIDDGFIPAAIKQENALEVLAEMKTDVESVDSTLDDLIAELEKDTNYVIFIAVFGTVGGLIIVALIIVTAWSVVKRKSAMKVQNKDYKKVSEETVPIEGFLSDHDNMGFQEDNSTRPKDNAYAMRDLDQSRENQHRDNNRTSNINDLYAIPHSKSSHYAKRRAPQPENPYSRQNSSKSSEYYSTPAYLKGNDEAKPGPSTRDYDRRSGTPKQEGPHSRQPGNIQYDGKYYY